MLNVITLGVAEPSHGRKSLLGASFQL